ncbi:MAG: CcdB family protein [Alphaproteobacteria bacterium]
MAKQFDLYRTVDGSLVLVLQSDLLEDLATRAVCLALPEGRGPQTLSALSPVLSAGDLRVRIAPHLVATLTLAELGSQVANFSHERDRIFRSMDMMLTGS